MSVKKYLLWTGLVVYAAFIFFIFYYYFTRPFFLIQTDLVSFLTGAKILKEGNGVFLYDVATQRVFQNAVVAEYGSKLLLPFRNLPLMAYFYQPLLFMNLKSSFILVFIANIFLIGIFYLAALHFFPKLKDHKYLIFLTLFFYPSASNLIVGQYTPLILLALFSIYILIKKENSLMAGIASSILATKLQYLLFVPFPFMLIKDKKRFVLGLLGGIGLFVILNIVLVGGIRPLLKYPNFILETENASFGSRPYQMFSLVGLASRFFPALSRPYMLIGNFLLYFLSLFMMFRSKLKSDINLFFSLGTTLTILFSVHTLAHDLIVFLMPIYLFLASEKKNDSKIAFYIFILAGVFCLFDSSLISILMMILFVVAGFNNFRLVTWLQKQVGRIKLSA